jgi:hypothetical protein
MLTTTLAAVLRKRFAPGDDQLDAVDAMTAAAWGMNADGHSRHDKWIMAVQDRGYRAADTDAAVESIVRAIRTIPENVLADAGAQLRMDAALVGHGGLRAVIASRRGAPIALD